MSIFVIILLAFLIALLVTCIWILIGILADWDTWFIISAIIIMPAVLVIGTFVGIGLNENNERLYIAKYEAQKLVIEQSIIAENISEFERLQLIKQVSELNGELAEKKAKYKLWNYVCYDEDLFSEVEFINLFEENKNEKT